MQITGKNSVLRWSIIIRCIFITGSNWFLERQAILSPESLDIGQYCIFEGLNYKEILDIGGSRYVKPIVAIIYIHNFTYNYLLHTNNSDFVTTTG